MNGSEIALLTLLCFFFFFGLSIVKFSPATVFYMKACVLALSLSLLSTHDEYEGISFCRRLNGIYEYAFQLMKAIQYFIDEGERMSDTKCV